MEESQVEHLLYQDLGVEAHLFPVRHALSHSTVSLHHDIRTTHSESQVLLRLYYNANEFSLCTYLSFTQNLKTKTRLD